MSSEKALSNHLGGSPPVVLQVTGWALLSVQQILCHFHLFLFNECLTPSNLESDYLPCALSFCFPLGEPGKHFPTISFPSPNKSGALVPLHCRRMDMSPAAVLAFW